MKPSFINSSHNEVLTSPTPHPRDETKVHIILSVDDFQRFCTDLIRHQVQFEVQYYPSSPTELSPKTLPSTSETAPSNKHQVSIIREIYHKYIEGDFTVAIPTERDIALQHGLKYSLFKNLFKQVYNQPFYQLYLEKRMNYAAQLLKKGYKANEVASMIGYSTSSAIKFNKMFQKQFNITPKKYQLQFFGKINRR